MARGDDVQLDEIFLDETLKEEDEEDEEGEEQTAYEAIMRKARSLIGLNQNQKQEDDIWSPLSSASNNALSSTKSVSSDDEKSACSLNILADAQSFSDLSPSVSRTKKFWRSFKKRTKKFRSFSRDRIDRLKPNTEGLSERWDSSPTSLAKQRHSKSCKNSTALELNGGDSESGRSQTDTKSINGQDPKDGEDLMRKVMAVDSKLSMLRSLPFFALNVILKEGKDLVVRDFSGTSDPYVRFMIGGKQFYRSRTVFKNLNPKWDERFSLPIEDPFQPIHIEVFDYDRGLNDDQMGLATIHPTQLDLNVSTDFKLMLSNRLTKRKKVSEYMGYLEINCTLVPKSQIDKEQYTGRMTKFVEQSKRLKTQVWNSIVTILLIDGRNLLSMDDNGFSDPYVKFRLGDERYKSKYKPKTLTPKWLEQFDLYMYDDKTSCLELVVWDHDIGGRDDLMGRAAIDLSILEKDKTHSIDVELEDGAGFLRLLITITGTANYLFSDATNVENTLNSNIAQKYGFLKSFRNLQDVGFLQVKVLKAKGLAAGDFSGKSDPFCVLELINARVQTTTEYKTLNPCWAKTFTFNIKDIHSILEVSVFDEDPDKKSDFLGKVAIPLLKIQNSRKRWYQLKDQKLIMRMKGAIKLEMCLTFNHVSFFKAVCLTIWQPFG